LIFRQFREFSARHAWPISLLIVAGYFLFFAVPAALKTDSFGQGTGMDDVSSMNDQLPTEFFLAASAVLIIVILGWARASGFRQVEPGGLKFAIAPAAFTGLLLGIAAVTASASGTSVFEIVGVQHLAVLVLMTLLVGVFEEGLFRGILMKGARTRFSPLAAVAITSVMFGLMHIVNYVGGQPLPGTIVQIIHAAVGGFMYGMLRLRIGALWPVILLHGFWDTTVATIGSTFAGLGEAAASAVQADAVTENSGGLAAFVLMMPELFYGLFMVWVYKRWGAKVDVVND